MKDVIIFQVAVKEGHSDRIFNQLKDLFEHNDQDHQISIFYLRKEKPKGEKRICIKVRSSSMRKAQVISLPIMQYINLLELGTGLIQDRKIDNFSITKKDKYFSLNDGSRDYSYEEIFYPQR